MTALVSSASDSARGTEPGFADRIAPPGPAAAAEPDSDEVLVARFVGGEKAAFETIVGRYRDRIYQLTRWFLGPDVELAEDATQEVLLQVYSSVSKFRHRSRFRTWLFAITRHVCRRQARRHRRLEPAGDQYLDLPDAAPDPLEAVEREEKRRLLRRAVSSLAPHHRAVMQLRDWEDLTYQEIAEVLEIPVGTVRSRLFNARAALASALASAFGDSHGR